jgi:F-box protein 20
MNLNVDSLNVIFQSEPKNSLLENQSLNNKNSENNNIKKATADLVPDIPPVEKVAEEMEKLILEQLEEEERAKELSSQQTKNSVGSPDHLLTAPPRLAEPPKEKPPPPPSANEGSQKDSSLKRVNSTKRIKKEIHKRRSNFLGIDNVDESLICSESSIPPPPALEEILKAEMELDRQSRLKIESAAIERLTLEEKEIMLKEREIIESLECEERQKQLLNGTEGFHNVLPTTPNDVFEDDRISSLKNERKRIETERLMTEEQQQLNLLEEKQLREREEFIRKQEAGKSAGSHSDSSLSVAANAPNNSKPAISSLTETKPKVSLSDSCGDGRNVTLDSTGVSENKSSEGDGKAKPSEKPAVPPKPLKKKEAIRKERERLRQEQEALQREREEHRQKLLLEQEELMKQQKSHAPDAPVTQLGPLPSLIQPNFPPQLTTTINATPNARESASFPSRSHHGASNGTAGTVNAGEFMGPLTVRQNRLPASRKAVQNEAWVQQKMPSVRKQNHDSLTESRYNQNHWLIQEAEMRRITELKERQQRTQLPCPQTHLAEDDVCSNPSRVPVIQPPTNYPVQDKMWNYAQPNMPPKKYPPPVVKDPLHTVYPREAVSQQPPSKPSRGVPMERQEQMLSVSGRKRCSHCNEELGRGAAMIIESLQLYYHIHCFQCCVCQAQLGNGSCGTDVRVRNNKLHCHNCYSNDEAGLKFSQV